MKIIYTAGPLQLETNGHGSITREEPRDMDDDYAYELVATRQVELADAASRETYAAMRKTRVDSAADQGLSIYCDLCGSELTAALYRAQGCQHCQATPQSVKGE